MFCDKCWKLITFILAHFTFSQNSALASADFSPLTSSITVNAECPAFWARATIEWDDDPQTGARHHRSVRLQRAGVDLLSREETEKALVALDGFHELQPWRSLSVYGMCNASGQNAYFELSANSFDGTTQWTFVLPAYPISESSNIGLQVIDPPGWHNAFDYFHALENGGQSARGRGLLEVCRYQKQACQTQIGNVLPPDDRETYSMNIRA